MINAKDQILSDLNTVSARLASLAADLELRHHILRADIDSPSPFMPLEDYDGRFVHAFTHIEKAKMAIRALHPLCQQADFLKKKREKKGQRT